jgi:membrane-bound serine protease (ClpP class)
MRRLDRRVQRLGGLWLLLLALSLVAGSARAQTTGTVKLAVFQGPVTPAMQGYLDRAIADAEDSPAAALVVELDTPGGSIDTTKQITQRMTQAKVPIIVYVAPSGAHAGSAGTFITLAGHLAAMVPGSSIGAASPVGDGGAELPATIKAKETNILVADITNLAARRGAKAVAWAQSAVAQAAAAPANEALSMGVIDAVAKDVPDLLRQLDGHTVTVAGQPVRLHLTDVPVERVPMTPIERFLNILTDPSLAAILLTIGLNAVIFEVASPGAYLPGIVGAICLLLAFYSLGTLNANWAGLGFIVVAFVLFVVDIKAPTHGLLSVGGLVSFVLGSFVLFNTSSVGVPWGTILTLALITASFFAFAIAKAVAIRRRRPVTGMEGMAGQLGLVRRALEPRGMVLVAGELWQAESDEGPLPVGTQVVVARVEGFRLHVGRPPVAQPAPAVQPEPLRPTPRPLKSPRPTVQ